MKSISELWGIVNNAGIFSCYGPDDWVSLDAYKLGIEVNCLGVIRVTQVEQVYSWNYGQSSIT